MIHYFYRAPLSEERTNDPFGEIIWGPQKSRIQVLFRLACLNPTQSNPVVGPRRGSTSHLESRSAAVAPQQYESSYPRSTANRTRRIPIPLRDEPDFFRPPPTTKIRIACPAARKGSDIGIRGLKTWVNDIRNPTVKKTRIGSESDKVRKTDCREPDDTIGSTVYKKKE